LTREAPSGLAKEFIDFVLSEEIQELVHQEGLIPVRRAAMTESGR